MEDQEKRIRAEARRLAKRHRRDFVEELERLEADSRARHEELSLRIQALRTLHNASDDGDTNDGSEGSIYMEEEQIEDPPNAHTSTSRPPKNSRRISERVVSSSDESGIKDSWLCLPTGKNMWHEGDDYILWKKKVFLELEARDSLFLLKEGAEPMGSFTEGEKLRKEAFLKSYVMSNIPEKYQKLVQDCQTAREMMQMLEKNITPPSQAREYSLQIDFMNLLFDPDSETVLEFRAKVDDLIREIRRCPTAELTNNQIRRNVLTAISGPCHQIYIDALENPDLSLEKIYDRMTIRFNAKEESQRRNKEASNGALLVSSKAKRNNWKGNAKPSNKRETRRSDTKEETSSKKTEWSNNCYRCGRLGHDMNNCRRKQRCCYNCFSDSHVARDCPKPLTERARKLRKELAGLMKKKRYDARRRKYGDFDGRYANNSGNAKNASKPSVHDRLGSRMDEESKMKSVVVDKRKEQGKNQTSANIAQVNRSRRKQHEGEGASGGSAHSFLSLYDGKYEHFKLIGDTGATEHLVNDISVFSTLRELEYPINISCAKNDTAADLTATHIGDIVVFNDMTNAFSILKDVLYVPSLLENLFSIRKLMTGGLVVQFSKDSLLIVDARSGEILKKGYFLGNFWWLPFALPLKGAGTEERGRILQSLGEKGLMSVERDVNPDCHTRSRRGSATHSEDSPRAGTSGENTKRSGCFWRDSASCTDSQRDDTSVESRSGIEETSTDNQQNEGTSSSNQPKRPRLDSLIETGGSPPSNPRAVGIRDSLALKWHYRLNHTSKKYLDALAKVVPELRGIRFGSEVLDCADCKVSKAKRKPFLEKRHRSNQLFSRLYSDLVGPIKPAAFRTLSRYFVTFTDDRSRYAFAYELTDKKKVHLALNKCLADIRVLSGPQTRVAELRTDGGLEYKTDEMKVLLKKEGILQTVCLPYTPEHNAVSERLNLELEEKIRVSLVSSGMPTSMWAFAMRHVTYIHNRTPNASNLFVSPYEMVMKRPPVLKYVRRFGCEAYVLHNKAKSLPKFAPRADLGFLLECEDTGYVLFHIQNKTTIRSKHVDFVEDRTYADYLEAKKGTLQLERGEDFEVQESHEITQEVGEQNPTLSIENSSEAGPSFDHKHSPMRIGGTEEFDFFEEPTEDAQLASLMLSVDTQEPRDYKQALGAQDASHWIDAMNEEFHAIERCGTWKIVCRKDVPKSLRIMKTRWVHKRKEQADGSIRYRSRLVVKGFLDNHQYELSEIYSPVARLPDVRFILNVAAKMDLELAQLDVKTAFLNGSLDKLVYIEIPDGYARYLNEPEDLSRSYVCEVHKALYGLKVSPRRWFVRFLEAVEKLDFKPYSYQPCLFLWKDDKQLAIMLLYVDDILIASNCPSKLSQVKEFLEQEFKITDLGVPKKFLGMEIERDRPSGIIRIHQWSYIQTMLERYDPDSQAIAKTPMVEQSSKRKASENSLTSHERNEIPYRQAIGSLLYVQNGSRPDISYAVNLLSRKQSDFSREHWDGVIRVLRYLRGTIDLKLEFKPQTTTIDCYVDASLGLSAEGGYSTTGYIIYVFGSPISWRTKKQNHVALSSAEAEFVAMSTACRELANLRTMCRELLGLRIIPVIHEDSRPAMRLAEVDDSSTLKHLVRLSYLYVREEHKQGNIQLEWVNTDQQIADTLTKPLAKPKFLKFRAKLMNSL